MSVALPILNKFRRDTFIQFLSKLPLSIPTDEDIQTWSVKQLKEWARKHAPLIEADRDVFKWLVECQHIEDEKRKDEKKRAVEFEMDKMYELIAELDDRIALRVNGVVLNDDDKKKLKTEIGHLQLIIHRDLNQDEEGDGWMTPIAIVLQYTCVSGEYEGLIPSGHSIDLYMCDEGVRGKMFFGQAFGYEVQVNQEHVRLALVREGDEPHPPKKTLSCTPVIAAAATTTHIVPESLQSTIVRHSSLLPDLAKIVSSYTMDCTCGRCSLFDIENVEFRVTELEQSKDGFTRAVTLLLDESFFGICTRWLFTTQGREYARSCIQMDLFGHILGVRGMLDAHKTRGNIEINYDELYKIRYEIPSKDLKCIFRNGRFFCITGRDSAQIIELDPNGYKIFHHMDHERKFHPWCGTRYVQFFGVWKDKWPIVLTSQKELFVMSPDRGCLSLGTFNTCQSVSKTDEKCEYLDMVIHQDSVCFLVANIQANKSTTLKLQWVSLHGVESSWPQPGNPATVTDRRKWEEDTETGLYDRDLSFIQAMEKDNSHSIRDYISSWHEHELYEEPRSNALLRSTIVTRRVQLARSATQPAAQPAKKVKHKDQQSKRKVKKRKV